MKRYIYSARSADFIDDSHKHGDCYETAANLVIQMGNDATLVHGIVTGQGALAGIQYGHAWVIKGNTVYDYSNGRHLEIPVGVYYAIGQIELTVEYSYRETLEHLVNDGTYGPWDKLFDDYL